MVCTVLLTLTTVNVDIAIQVEKTLEMKKWSRNG